MAEERINEIGISIKEFLENRRIRADKIFLFGSYAKGNFTEDSDIDIAIISRDFEGKDIFQKADMLGGLNWMLVEKFTLPFDILAYSLDEWENSKSMMVEFIKEDKMSTLL